MLNTSRFKVFPLYKRCTPFAETAQGLAKLQVPQGTLSCFAIHLVFASHLVPEVAYCILDVYGMSHLKLVVFDITIR